MWRWARKKERDIEKSAGQRLDFRDSRWIISAHRPNLITKISKPEEKESWLRSFSSTICHGATANRNHEQPPARLESFRINLAEMQRLYLRQLQHKLVQHAVKLTYNVVEPVNWQGDLRKYVQALQDFDYIGLRGRVGRDPFYVTGERYIDRCMLEVAMDRRPLKDLDSKVISGIWETAESPSEPVGGPRDVNYQQAWIKGFQIRFGGAVLGGVFLIFPMWLIILHRTLYTGLVTATVLVVVFGLIMALSLSTLMDVVSATAAYAAVLVVFVSLTTTP